MSSLFRYLRIWSWWVIGVCLLCKTVVPPFPPRDSRSMSITHITSLSQLDAILDKSPTKLTVGPFPSWPVVTLWLSELTSSSLNQQVVDFHATWSVFLKMSDQMCTGNEHLCRCGPCHAIAPAYEALSKQYLSVNFLKCDVDAAQDVARRYAVSAMWVTDTC